MGRKPGDTKEKLMFEALRLFAEKGYECVSMADIAATLGHSAPAIYKHYPNKKALFDEVIEKSNQACAEHVQQLRNDFLANGEADEASGVYLVEKQISQMKEMMNSVLHEEGPSLFRKLLLVEQFHHPELAVLFNQRYIEDEIEMFTNAFTRLIELGVMKSGDPYVMAMQYYAPISVMIGKCDRDPSCEAEALEKLEKHIRMFNDFYRVDKPKA